jgi:hypothetical protein
LVHFGLDIFHVYFGFAAKPYLYTLIITALQEHRLLVGAGTDPARVKFAEYDLQQIGRGPELRYSQLFYIGVRSALVLSCHPEDTLTQVCISVIPKRN